MKSTLCYSLFLVSVFTLEDGPSCYMPIDVIFLQDTTGSFKDDLPIVTRQIPDMVKQILIQNPNSHFGVAEFKDKPFYPLGSDDDDCYKLNGPLSSSMEDFQEAYGTLYASGGGDLPEAQYQALIDLAEDSQAGWRPLKHLDGGVSGEDPTVAGARLIIMSTDALPHLSGDGSKFHAIYPDTVPDNLATNPGTTINQNTFDLCTKTDYPSPQQVKEALKANSIYLAILTPNQDNITGAWKWVNEQLLEQPAGFYQYIESDSSDIMSGVLQVLKEVTAAACAETTTTTTLTTTRLTTAAPTTIQPTTTAAPTTTQTTGATTTKPVTTAAPTTTQTTASTTTQPTTTAAPTTTQTNASTTTKPTTTAVPTTPQPTTTAALTTTQPSTTRVPTTTTTATSTTTQPRTTAAPTTAYATARVATLTTGSGECDKPCPEVCIAPCKDECCQRPAVRFELLKEPKRVSVEFE